MYVAEIIDFRPIAYLMIFIIISIIIGVVIFFFIFFMLGQCVRRRRSFSGG